LRVIIPPIAAEKIIDPEITWITLLGLAHERHRLLTRHFLLEKVARANCSLCPPFER
jgi:hypothetical protein